MALPRPRIPEYQNVFFPVQEAAFQQRPHLPRRFAGNRLTSKFCSDFSSGNSESFNNRCTLDFRRCSLPARSPPADIAH